MGSLILTGAVALLLTLVAPLFLGPAIYIAYREAGRSDRAGTALMIAVSSILWLPMLAFGLYMAFSPLTAWLAPIRVDALAAAMVMLLYSGAWLLIFRASAQSQYLTRLMRNVFILTALIAALGAAGALLAPPAPLAMRIVFTPLAISPVIWLIATAASLVRWCEKEAVRAVVCRNCNHPLDDLPRDARACPDCGHPIPPRASEPSADPR